MYKPGLPTVAVFFETGERLLKRARFARQPTALIMFDLDRFKSIDDRYGHHTGDEVLTAFCRLATSQLRPNDLFGCIGGEEFACFLPDTGHHCHSPRRADPQRGRNLGSRLWPRSNLLDRQRRSCDCGQGAFRSRRAAGLSRQSALPRENVRSQSSGAAAALQFRTEAPTGIAYTNPEGTGLLKQADDWLTRGYVPSKPSKMMLSLRKLLCFISIPLLLTRQTPFG
jgi:GGDEF domain-containing protein